MAFDEAAAIDEPFGGVHDTLGIGLASRWLKSSPIEWEGYEIEELEKFFVVQFRLGFGFAGEFVVGEGDDAGAGDAEEELVIFLGDGDFAIGEGAAVFVENREGDV